MNLPMRQNTKRKQALDALASLAKTWSEWRLGEKATKSVAKGTKKASKARKRAAKAAKNADASSVKNALRGTPLKVAGGLALVGGIGAAVAKKLKGGGTAEPLYTPPPAPAPMEPPVELKDVPPAPKTSVVVGDLAPDEDGAPQPAAAAPDDAGAKPDEDAGTDSAVARSEAAAAAAAAPAPDDATEPTVPDTEPETDITDAGDDVDAATGTAVTAEADADAGELEAAPAGDGHDDDAPAVPSDDDAKS